MTEQKKQELFKKVRNLLNNIIENEDKYAEQIVKVISKTTDETNNEIQNKNIEQIDKNKIILLWENSSNDIIDIIYNSLTEVYSMTLNGIKKIYKIKIDNTTNLEKIIDLTYHKDNIYLDERIKNYCNNYANNLINNLNEIKNFSNNLFFVKNKLNNEIYRIFKTEINHVFNHTMKNKLSPYGEYIITSGGECCPVYEGLEDEIDIPPYHPNCDCTYIIETTDDIGEMEELGMDDEIDEAR